MRAPTVAERDAALTDVYRELRRVAGRLLRSGRGGEAREHFLAEADKILDLRLDLAALTATELAS